VEEKKKKGKGLRCCDKPSHRKRRCWERKGRGGKTASLSLPSSSARIGGAVEEGKKRGKEISFRLRYGVWGGKKKRRKRILLFLLFCFLILSHHLGEATHKAFLPPFFFFFSFAPGEGRGKKRGKGFSPFLSCFCRH